MKWIKRILLSVILIPLILLLLVVSFFSFRAILNPWTEVITLPKLYRPSSIFFTGSNGIIAGHGESDSLKHQSYKTIGTSLHDNAFIYASQDNGISWNLKYEKKNGSIRRISHNSSNNILYALGHENLGNEEDTSFIIISKDNGFSWNRLVSHNIQYLGFDYSCKNTRYIWSPHQIDIQNSSGSDLSVELPSNCSMYSRIPVTDSFCNLWIGCQNELLKISQNGQKEVIVTKINTWVDEVEFNRKDSSIWFIVRHNDSSETVLYRSTVDGKITKIKSFPRYLPGDLLISGDIVAIPFTNTANKSILGLEKVLFYSMNLGKSWKEDFFYPAFSREPFFLKDNEIYVNAAMQRIEKREL